MKARISGIFVGFFTHNIILKIVSLLFAIILWNYVNIEANPIREKVLTDVPVMFKNEQMLQNERLTVRGDRKLVLKNISATVSVQLSNVGSVTQENITATVDLQTIKSAGKYTLRINAISSLGTVVATNPSTIEVEVDSLTTRPIPVQTMLDGSLPEGYWHGSPDVSPQTIFLEGPATDLKQVQQAVCYIPLDERTTSYNESMSVVLMDSNKVVKDPVSFNVELPTVIVKMDVFPKKTVPVEYASALLGLDKLAEGYEFLGAKLSQTEVEIAGPPEALDNINSISIDSINLQNASDSLLTTSSLRVPPDVILLSKDTVEIFVEISKIVQTDKFGNIPVKIFGLTRGLTASLEAQEVSVEATGPIGTMKYIEKRNIEVSVDLTGLGEGTHQVKLSLLVPEKLESVNFKTIPETVTVIIKKR